MTTAEKTAYITGKLSEICDYLRIDTGDDDTIVTADALAAIEYIESAVGTFNEDDPTAFLLLCALTQDFYDNRELMQSEQQLKKRQEYTYQSIILQLRMKYELSQDGSEEESE